MKDNIGQKPRCAVDRLSESLSLTIKNQVELNFSLTCDFVTYVLWLMFCTKKSTCCKFTWENKLFPVLDWNYSFGALCTVSKIWLSVHLPLPTPNMFILEKKACCSTIAMKEGGLENWKITSNFTNWCSQVCHGHFGQDCSLQQRLMRGVFSNCKWNLWPFNRIPAQNSIAS